MRRREFTDEMLYHLRACRAQGMTRKEAAQELGVSTTWLDTASKRAGLTGELKAIFPHGGNPPEKVEKPDPVVHWLTKPWRKAA